MQMTLSLNHLSFSISMSCRSYKSCIWIWSPIGINCHFRSRLLTPAALPAADLLTASEADRTRPVSLPKVEFPVYHLCLHPQFPGVTCW